MKYLKALVLCLALALSGCGKSRSSSHQVLRINLESDPATLDPRKARDLNAMTLCRMLYEGLTRISREGKPELALAESVAISEDGREYVFHLRKAFWSNGDPVTSYDFAESWKAMLSPEFPTDMAYQLYCIENAKNVKLGQMPLEKVGIESPNDSVFIVRLEQPTPYFLEACAIPSFFPVPRIVAKENPNWALEARTFIGNGPFVLKSWDHTNEIRVVKNPLYWDAEQIHLQEISMVMVTSDTEIQMFEEGTLHRAGSPLSTLPIDAIKDLQEREKLKISPLSGTQFLRVNVSETVGGKTNVLSKPEARKALALAINRNEIVDHILQGGQTPAMSFVPPEMGLFGGGYFREQSLFQFPSAQVVLSFIAGDRTHSIAQAIQQQWEKTLGIQVQLEALEAKVFFQKVKQKDYQVAFGSWIADFNDPINFLEVFKFKASSTNNTNWENRKYVELLDRSAICKDQGERMALLRKAEEILMDEMPIIPIFHYAMNFLQSNEVQDIALSPIGQIDLRWSHIDSDTKVQQ